MLKYRFKKTDGSDYPNWKEDNLSAVCDIVGGGTPNTKINEYWDGDIQWFTPTEMTKKYVSNSKRKITALGLQKSSAKLLPIGTVLLTTRATLGAMAITVNKCTTNQGFHSLITNNRCINEYLYYLQPLIKKYCENHAFGSTFREISKSSLEKCIIPLPCKEEQQKIADFLSAVDNQIEIQRQRVDVLELQKKGLLDKVFSQKLRFKKDDGSNYPDWEEDILENLCDVRDGTHDSPKYHKKGFPFITSKNITAEGDIDFTDAKYIAKEDYDKFNLRSNVDEGDILFAMIGTIGKPVIVKKVGFAIKNVALIKMSLASISTYYLYTYLQTHFIKSQFKAEKLGSTQKFIALKKIRKLSIRFPHSEEQQKIADFFTAIDNQIDIEKQRLTTMETIKKGLLQQMFM